MKRKRQAYVFFILLFLAITTVIVLSIKNNTNEKVYTNNSKPLYNFSLTSSAKNYTASSNDKDKDKNKINVAPNNKINSNTIKSSH